MNSFIKYFFKLMGLEISRLKKNKPLAIVETAPSRKTRSLTYHQTKTGNYFLPTDAKEDVVANTMIANMIFEKEVVDLALQYIKPKTAVLDIGANFGQMSVLFSEMVGAEGKVYSFDADDWIFEIFKKNIEANNKVGQIIPHFGAIHDKDGEIMIFPDQDFVEFGAYGSYGINYNAKKGEGREVVSLTIDSLEIPEIISFMKIDIQGGDLNAMRGAIKTIQKNRMPILFEYEYHFEDRFNMSFQDYVDFVSEIGYQFKKVVSGHNFLIIPKERNT